MKTRRRTLAGLALVATIGLAACSAPESGTVAGDYPAYESVDDLVAAADLVVEVAIGGSVEDVLLPLDSDGTDDPRSNPQAGVDEASDTDDEGLPITVFDATVTAVHLGDAREGEVIEIGQVGGAGTTAAGVSPLIEGERVLVFLETYADSPASVLGGDVGTFTLQGETYVSLGDAQLTVTRDALRALTTAGRG